MFPADMLKWLLLANQTFYLKTITGTLLVCIGRNMVNVHKAGPTISKAREEITKGKFIYRRLITSIIHRLHTGIDVGARQERKEDYYVCQQKLVIIMPPAKEVRNLLP